MGSVWAGSYNRSLRLGHTPQLRGWFGGISAPRRAADRAVMLFTNRRRPVQLSPLADALAQLERIQIASGRGGGQPARSEALTAGRDVQVVPVGCAPSASRPVPYEDAT